MFRRRVGGVYFAIITQSLTAILTILVIGQQGFTGGVNGITDLRTLLGWDIRTDAAKEVLYLVNGALQFACLLLARFILKSKLGRVLVAMRDQEDRVRFSGYDVAQFKMFVFCAGAAFAGVGGAMFTLQVGFMSPTLVGIVPSIEMVIFCAVGGRLSILGAVYGTLLVNWAKTTFSESFPELWLLGLGALFIGVVMASPATRRIACARSPSHARNLHICQLTSRSSQARRHTALDLRSVDQPTSTPSTLPSDGILLIDWSPGRCRCQHRTFSLYGPKSLIPVEPNPLSVRFPYRKED